jgi:hypothetical protein
MVSEPEIIPSPSTNRHLMPTRDTVHFFRRTTLARRAGDFAEVAIQ